MQADSDIEAVARAIRRAREARDLSQEKLAELAELHRNYIGLLERGERNPRLSTLFAIAKALEISARDLLA